MGTRLYPRWLQLLVVWGVVGGAVGIALWPLLQQPGFVGFRHDWAIAAFGLDQARRLLTSAWQAGGLGSATTFGTDVIARAIGALGSLTPISPTGWNSLLFALPLIGGALAMSFFLLRTVRVGSIAAITGGLLYVATPLVYDRALLGYLWYLVAYALLPIYLWTSLAFLERDRWSWRHAAVSALVLIGLGTQIHFFVIAPTLLVVIALVLKQGRRVVGLVAFQAAAAIGVNLFWFLPLAVDGSLQSISLGATVTDWLTSRTVSSWVEQLTATNHPNQQAANLAGANRWWLVALIVTTALAWLAAVSHRARPRWSAVVAVSFVLGLGVVGLLTPPFGAGVAWLFDHVAVVRVFREPVHWMGVVAFAVSLGVALSIDRIVTTGSKLALALGAALGAVTVAGVSFPAWSGSFAHELSPVVINAEYTALNAQADPRYRTFWWPMIGPFRYRGSAASINFDPVIESFRSPSFSTEGGRLLYGGRSTQVRNYVIDRLVEGDLVIARVLERLGVRDIIVREDVENGYAQVTSLGDFPAANERFRGDRIGDRLRAVPDAVLTSSTPTVSHYTLPRPAHIISVAEHPISTGEDLGGLRRDADAVFFLDPVVAGLVQRGTIPLADDELSRQEQRLTSQAIDRIEPGPAAGDHFDAREGWTRALYWWWRDPFVAAVREQAVIAETSDALTITVPPSQQPLTLWAKVGGLTESTVAEFSSIHSTVSVTLPLKSWRWLPVQTLLPHAEALPVTVRASAGVPLVATFITTALELPDRPIEELSEPEAAPATLLGFNQLSLTDYRASVRAERPFWLVFRQSFNPGWVATVSTRTQPDRTLSPVLVDGYANAFFVESTGDLAIRIVYQPQRLYSIGLAVSFATVLALIGLLWVAPRLPRRVPLA